MRHFVHPLPGRVFAAFFGLPMETAMRIRCQPRSRRLERPDECVLGRDPNPHIAFGHGSHKCAGIDVALTELRIALTELLARTERFALAGTERFALAGTVTPLRWPLAGPAVLPLRGVGAG